MTLCEHCGKTRADITELHGYDILGREVYRTQLAPAETIRLPSKLGPPEPRVRLNPQRRAGT